MKLSEFRTLIKEEVKKVLHEATTTELLSDLEDLSDNPKFLVKALSDSFDIYELENMFDLNSPSKSELLNVLSKLLKTPEGRKKILSKLKVHFDPSELQNMLAVSGGPVDKKAALEALKIISAKMKKEFPDLKTELKTNVSFPGIYVKLPVIKNGSPSTVTIGISQDGYGWSGDAYPLPGEIKLNKVDSKNATLSADKIFNWISKFIKKHQGKEI